MPSSSAIELVLRRAAPGSEGASCEVTVSDPDLVGHRAELEVRLRVNVLDSRPVNAEKEVFRTRFRLDREHLVVPLPAESLRCYTYRGEKIEMEVLARLTVDDHVFFDTTAEEEVAFALADKPDVRNDAQELIEPKDAFDFRANLRAIPAKNRGIVGILLAIGAVVVGLNTLLGLHDQFVPEPQTYFYSHRDHDGDSQSPLAGSLAGSGIAGALLWLAVRHQLRKYMRFELVPPATLRRGTRLPAAQLVRGVARVPLEEATVRVVAANRERGQYVRGSGTKKRTVSFETPVRAVVLYEERLLHVPAHRPVESYLPGEVDFEPMFAALYPPISASSHHGIDVVWEVQLIHPLFVDQELQGPTDGLRYEDFLAG